MDTRDKAPYLKYIWGLLVGLVYLAVVVGILSVATTRFETLVLAGMIQLYAASLHNSSILAAVADTNNYAGFVRFRILATAQGVTEDEAGTFVQQEEALQRLLKRDKTAITIQQLSHGAVSLYALFKIVQTVFL